MYKCSIDIVYRKCLIPVLNLLTGSQEIMSHVAVRKLKMSPRTQIIRTEHVIQCLCLGVICTAGWLMRRSY